jgi:hypothetical protein
MLRPFQISAALSLFFYAISVTANQFLWNPEIILGAMKKASALRADLYSARSPNIVDIGIYMCLDALDQNIMKVYPELLEIENLVILSSNMISPEDEANVNTQIIGTIRSTLSSLSSARSDVNVREGLCSSSALVIAKAQDTLRLFNEIEMALRQVGPRGE